MLSHRKKAKRLLLFFSLTREQVVRGNSTLELEMFLSESRFPFHNESDHYIVLSRFPIITFRDRNRRRKLMTMTYLGLFLRSCSISDLIMVIGQSKSIFRRNQDHLRPIFVNCLLQIEERLVDASINSLLCKPNSQLQLVTTQTHIHRRPSYMKEKRNRCQRYMIWYSTNSVPILKQSENQTRYLPKELSTDCDHHFVWDQYQAEEFAHQGIFKTEVKGSMIFVPRSRQEVRLQSEHKSVVIFDVTPFRPSIGYYSGETCEANLRMIIQACEEASSLLDDPISIWLKPKRKYSNRSDADYITLVKELSKSYRVRLLNPKANLYDVMNLSSAVISVPFTSPAILAREAKLPSVFAAIEDAEWLIPKEHHGLPVIRNQRALANWLVDEIDD